MTENTILIIGVSAIVLLLLFLVWVLLGRRRLEREQTPYVDALDALLSGDRKGALEKLRAAVRVDSQNVDAYLKLGNLLREEGDIDRAVKVHKSLTVRSLSPAQRREVLKALASDYLAAGKYSQARHLVETVLSHNRKELWALEMLLTICEERGQWDTAFDVVKQIQQLRGKDDRELLGLYKVYAGQALDAAGEHHRARLKYKEAIRIDARCTPAYLSLGDSYAAERRLDDAITFWRKLMESVPEHAYLSFPRLERAHFELGDFSSMAHIYEDLIERRPGDLRSLFALANIMEKMGKSDEAVRLCRRALELDPDSQQARRCLVTCYHATGDDSRAVEYALELAERSASGVLFRCTVCGHESDDALWRCPQCKKWRTFL